MRLTESVHIVASGALGFGLSHELDCHVYLVNAGAEMALIDAGVGLQWDRIVANIRSDGLDPGKLKFVRASSLRLAHSVGDRPTRARVRTL